jgi:tetratricopeptide (TPR) repeat protein
MSKQTDKSLFIVPSMPGFYQQLLSGIGSYQELGNRIIRQIKAAHAFRQVERVSELARVLINIPVKEYQLIVQYYLVWCKCREYQYPAETLEKIVEQTRTYKTNALFSRAAIEIYQGNLESAFYFYSEAFKSSPTISEYIDLSRSIAGLKALEGFHGSALKDLESLIPLIKHAEPRLYFDFLNSYAVELGEAGRLQEARNVSSLVQSSPFIHAYPEWQETHAH